MNSLPNAIAGMCVMILLGVSVYFYLESTNPNKRQEEVFNTIVVGDNIWLQSTHIIWGGEVSARIVRIDSLQRLIIFKHNPKGEKPFSMGFKEFASYIKIGD